MIDEGRVRAVTSGMRWVRDYLRGEATETIQTIKQNVDDGKLSVDTWGVRLDQTIGGQPEPGGWREPQLMLGGKMREGADPNEPKTWDGGFFNGSGGWVDDPLTAFKKNYEAAHDSAISRLGELIQIFDEVAETLNGIADHYDEIEDENERDAEGIDTDG